MGYSGGSVVDYLKSVGQATDFGSRAKLASEKGISNYSGTAEQNTQLLGILRGAGAAPAPGSAAPSPAQTGTTADNGMLYGGWYDNPATGKNQRYWGNGIWTNGEEPGLPKSADQVTGFLNTYQNSILNKSMPEVRNMLSGGLEKPATLNREQAFTDLRTEYGVSDLETSLNDLKAQEDEIVAQFREQRTAERGKTVATNVIAGRIGQEERAASERLDYIGRQKSRVVDELNTKYSIIGQIMQFKSQDYADAVQSYESEFNQNLQIYKLISDEKSTAETAARANLQIYMNAITAGNLDMASLPADQKVMINKLEAQAGLPVGFTSSLKLDPKANILFTSSNDGVTQVGVRNPDGTISVQSYGTKTPGKQTEAEASKQLNSLAVNAFETVKGGDGYVDPKDYKEFKKEWIAQGGSAATFDSQFSSYINPSHPESYGVSREFIDKNY